MFSRKMVICYFHGCNPQQNSMHHNTSIREEGTHMNEIEMNEHQKLKSAFKWCNILKIY